MKRAIWSVLLSILWIPFLGQAQTTENYYPVYYCNSNVSIHEAVGCEMWIEDGNGDLVESFDIGSTLEPSGQSGSSFVWSFSLTYDPDLAPYTLNFDETCLVDQDLSLSSYSYPLTAVGDTVFLCSDYLPGEDVSFMVVTQYKNCVAPTEVEMLHYLFETNCMMELTDVNGNIIDQRPIATMDPNLYFQMYTFDFVQTSSPYTLTFDEACLNTHGFSFDQYEYLFTSDSIANNMGQAAFDICVYNDSVPFSDSTSTYHVVFEAMCDSLNNEVLNSANNCIITVKDKNGVPVADYPILGDVSNYHYIQSLSFPTEDDLFPYTIEFDDYCLLQNNIEMDQYIFTLNNMDPETNEPINNQHIPICAQFINAGDSCVNVYAGIFPYIGYYQNTANKVQINWGNFSPVAVDVTVTIEMPEGVAYSSSYWYDYEDNGTSVSISATLNPNAFFSDVLTFDVPGGTDDGTLHTYGISILVDNDTLVDCVEWNNTDSLNMIVGNSYDPNAKTVGLPTMISPNVQDEFLYTIYFQNTGTAPAQDVYIVDTLSENLDWSTFEYLRASHQVGIADLGNGIKKFYFDQIWLPDSTTDFAGSNGFVTFKIKEKASNELGSEIFNTAYIFFDHNDAIITNTTYNINTETLGVANEQSVMDVHLFPNPTYGKLNVVASENIEKLAIYSMDGRMCESMEPNQRELVLNTSMLKQGMYFLKVSVGSNEKTIRFVRD